MDVCQRGKLFRFAKEHVDSRSRLNAWYRIISESQYSDMNELRRTFSRQVDYVAPYYVFDIGLQYRLIARIDFKSQRVIIGEVLTHREYDRGTWKD